MVLVKKINSLTSTNFSGCALSRLRYALGRCLSRVSSMSAW